MFDEWDRMFGPVEPHGVSPWQLHMLRGAEPAVASALAMEDRSAEASAMEDRSAEASAKADERQ